MAGIVDAMKNFINDLTGGDNDDDRLEHVMRKAMPLFLLFVTGMIFYNYNSEKLSCMKTGTGGQVSDDFYHGYCWAKGIYLYRELMEESQYENIGIAVGIPRELEHNGMKPDDTRPNKNVTILCPTHNDYGRRHSTCNPLNRVYYRQHHWLYQVLLAIAIGMALPYLAHLFFNKDLVNLQRDMTKFADDENKQLIRIHDRYFPVNELRGNTLFRMTGSLAVKLIYLLMGILMFVYLDKAFEYRFGWYVIDIYKWMVNEHNLGMDFVESRKQNIFTPGDELIPVLGMCEFTNTPFERRGSDTGRLDIITACEMNSNKLAQHWMIYVWFIMVGYIILAIWNVLNYFLRFVKVFFSHRTCSFFNRRCYHKATRQDVYDCLTVRQIYLLRKLEKCNPLFVDRLAPMILSTHPPRKSDTPDSCDEASRVNSPDCSINLQNMKPRHRGNGTHPKMLENNTMPNMV